ncbi:MAG: D-alanyl-D-alanine carboxypeptidase/D-alanyl-D-alanine endopeptidase, partial [Myxococcota bacterium]
MPEYLKPASRRAFVLSFFLTIFPSLTMIRTPMFLLIGLSALITQPVFADGGQDEDTVYSLEERIAPILRDPALHGTEFGLQVVNVRTGEEVFAHDPDEKLVPASVMKVLTAAVAMRELGAGYRFSTYVSADGAIDADGVLDGDLYVQGFGDPTVVTENLWRLAYDLRLSGLRKVEGDIIYDDQHFDSDRLIAGWRKDLDMANGPAYFAPLGALSVNFNTACLVVRPGSEAGVAGEVALEAPHDAVKVVNKVTTGSRRSRSRLNIVRSKRGKDQVTFEVSGSVPFGADSARFYRSIVDPLSQFQGVFSSHLESHGIEISGEHKRGEAPKSLDMLARHESAALPSVLARMNKHSSNFIAEHVLKAVGAEVYGKPGTTRKGLAVVGAYLESLGASSDDFDLVNGSGLSRDSYLPPSLVNAVLIDMANDPILAPEFTA